MRVSSSKSRPGIGPPGWTLPELLTALVVVGVLAGLLLMGGREVQRRTWTAQSAANLHLLALANLRYATDHGGSFCPAQDTAGLIRWHGGRANLTAKFDPTQGYLYPYLQDGGASLVCPLFQLYPLSKDSFENGAGDYGYNARYIGGTPNDLYTPEKMANVTNPAHTVMFTDTCLPRSDGIQEYPFSEPWQPVSSSGQLNGSLTPSVHFRHNGLAQVAWCDGSVTAESPTRLGGVNLYGGAAAKYQVGWMGPSENNGWWNSRQVHSP